MKVDNVTYSGASLAEQKVLNIKDTSNFTDEATLVQGHTQGTSKAIDSEIESQQNAYNVTKPLKPKGGNREDSGAEG